MIDFIVIAIILAAVIAAAVYIIHSKKKGQKCIGCPYSGSCGSENCPSEKNKIPAE